MRGAEAYISTVSLGSFVAARALSTGFNDKPTEASRPFDERRDGVVMGEGAGIVVVEDLEHAIARGARPLAEIIGYGTTSDAFPIGAHDRAMATVAATVGGVAIVRGVPKSDPALSDLMLKAVRGLLHEVTGH